MFGSFFSKLFGGGIGSSANSLVNSLTQSGVWDKIKSGSKTLGRETTRIALELYYVMRSPETPVLDKVIIGVALGYQFTPGIMSKEKYGPLLSLVDNAVTLAVAYDRVKKRVTPAITAQVNEQLAQWFPTPAAAPAPASSDPVAIAPSEAPVIPDPAPEA